MKNHFFIKKSNSLLITMSLSLLSIFSCSDNSLETIVDDSTKSIQVKKSTKSELIPIVTAFSDNEQDRNPASNAIDSDAETRWSGFGNPANLTLDLGTDYLVDYVKIAWFKGDTRQNSFKIYTSSDTESWTLVKTQTSSGTSDDFEEFDLSNSTGRYVKVECNGNTYNYWNSISEIEVYGIGLETPQLLNIQNIVAENEQEAHPAQNSIDKDPTTRWSGFGNPVDLTLDLGTEHAIDHAKIAWHKGDQRSFTFNVHVSTDGNDWIQITSETSSGSTADFEDYSLGNTSARFVRFECLGNSINNWNSISEIEIYGRSGGGTEPNPDTNPNPTPTPVPTPNGANPWDFFINCDQWKITWPNGEEEKQLCSQGKVTDVYEVSPENDALVFTVKIDDDNGSTKNSSYIRSELRERNADGSSDIYWTTSGDHALYIQQAITHLPIVKDHLVAGQIHGNKEEGIDDSMVVRLEGEHLFLSFNGGKLRSDFTIKEDYQLGDVFEVIFRVIDGKHYCYYSEDGNLRTAYNSGNANQYLLKDGDKDYVLDISYGDAYFKVGNYTQSNPDREGSETGNPDNYGQVYVYAFNVNHEGEEL